MNVQAIAEGPDGRLWFGTPGGACRYDGEEWLTLTASEGLPHNVVRAVFEDRDGHIWLGTAVGVSRYDGALWQHFTPADGLPHGSVWTLAQDRVGRVWMGSSQSGAASFDGTVWRAHGIDEGLPPRGSSRQPWDVYSRVIFADTSGRLWFGTLNGVSRLDDDTWMTFDRSDGLGDNFVWCVAEDLRGHIWVGTATGASRYDGQAWSHYTPEDGMARGMVRTILVDGEGQVWFGSDGYGVTVFDGETFRTLTTSDGLAHNSLRSMLLDRTGHIWFGTDAGLVSRFDGEVFQTLTAEDGLTGQSVRSIIQDRKGDIWFATYGGVVRFRQPPARPPSVRIDAVVADRRHRSPRQLSVPSTVKLVVFEFHGSSFKTRPGGMVYRYRLRGVHEWRTTRAVRMEYDELPTGDYTLRGGGRRPGPGAVQLASDCGSRGARPVRAHRLGVSPGAGPGTSGFTGDAHRSPGPPSARRQPPDRGSQPQQVPVSAPHVARPAVADERYHRL